MDAVSPEVMGLGRSFPAVPSLGADARPEGEPEVPQPVVVAPGSRRSRPSRSNVGPALKLPAAGSAAGEAT